LIKECRTSAARTKSKGDRGISLPNSSSAFETATRDSIEEYYRRGRIKELLNPETPQTTKTICLKDIQNESVIHFIKSLLKIQLERNYFFFGSVTMV
jgi:uncharacterized protein YicC (UPF0701 family)